MEENNVVLYHGAEIQLEEKQTKTGLPYLGKILFQDPDSGMMVEYIHYPKGTVAWQHTHTCGHGMYVLKGVLYTDRGDIGPGGFVWFPQGTVMEHGAKDGDVDCLFITNKTFDINYMNQD